MSGKRRTVIAIVFGAALLVVGIGIYRLARNAGIIEPKPRPIVWSAHWDVVRFPALSSATRAMPGGRQTRLVGETLLVNGGDLRLHALDPATGAERWAFGARSEGVAGLFTEGERLVVHVLIPHAGGQSTRSRMVELDLDSGAEVWRRDLPVDVYASGVVLVDGKLFLVGQDQMSFEESLARRRAGGVDLRPRLLSLDGSGDMRWETTLRRATDENSVIFGVSVLHVSSAIIVKTERRTGAEVEVLDAESGKRLWERTLTTSREAAEIIAWRDTVLVARSDHLLILDGATGESIDEIPVERLLGDGMNLDWIVDRDTLFVFAEGSQGDDTIRAIDLPTQRVVWSRRLDRQYEAGFLGGNFFSPRPLGVYSGSLFFGARDANIFELRTHDGSVKRKFFVGTAGSIEDIPPIPYKDLVILSDLYVTAYRP